MDDVEEDNGLIEKEASVIKKKDLKLFCVEHEKHLDIGSESHVMQSGYYSASE